MSAKPTVEELNAFFVREFPQARVRVDELGHCSAKVRHEVGDGELRPGGTVSGPVMMTTADVALYAAILGEIGLIALAVTTNLNINFLRKPVAGRDIIGVCSLLNLSDHYFTDLKHGSQIRVVGHISNNGGAVRAKARLESFN